MAKTWVLDTETKGTGAHIAPLPRAEEGTGARALDLVTLKRPARPRPSAQPRPHTKFKVVDVLGARVLGEGVGVRETLALLERVRSALDVRVYARSEGDTHWRLLTLAEQRSLWELSERRRSAQPA
jgi:hypothetical protein